MAPKGLLVLAGVLLLLASSHVSAEKEQLTNDAVTVPETTATVGGGAGESKQRRCRCCWFYLGNCVRYCCLDGQVIPADVGAKAEPHNVAATVPETTATVGGGAGETKQRRCRCCWFYRGNCVRFCCLDGQVIPAEPHKQVIPADVGAKAEPHN